MRRTQVWNLALFIRLHIPVCVCALLDIDHISWKDMLCINSMTHTHSILSVINKVVDNNFLSNSSYFECESRDWYLLSLAITTCTTDSSNKHMLWINIKHKIHIVGARQKTLNKDWQNRYAPCRYCFAFFFLVFANSFYLNWFTFFAK